jgi:predicted O-linked N-acetylglucosamine transferase (SPINDLY family)
MFKKLLDRFSSAPPPAPLPPAAPQPQAAAPVVLQSDIPQADRLIEEGNGREDAGDLAGAEALYRRAAAAAPGHARAWLNLGIALASKGDEDAAARAYDTVLAIDRGHANGNYNYARLAWLRGDYPRAEALARMALQGRPDFPQAFVVLSNALEAQDKLAEAADALESAARLQPDDAGVWFNLAVLMFAMERPERAETAARRLLELDPEHPAGLAMLSRALRAHEFTQQVLEPLRKAMRNDPDDLVYPSQELMLLNFVEGLPAAEVHARHRAFGARLEARIPARFERFEGTRDPERRLRVGFVSSDLRTHPVALFLLPVLEHLDRAAVEVFCYSTGHVSDGFTERLRAHSDHWIDAGNMSDERIADAIHADAIDLLVDLAGHTSAPRLGVFSQRPAPVQASWLGYLNSTGLTRIDYRLSDAGCDPIDRSQPLHSERLLLLPDRQWCYRPWSETSLQPVAPFERNGYITFGSFNSSTKLTNEMLMRWAALLHRLPDARLRIGDTPSERKRAAVTRAFTGAGIDAARFEFLPRVGTSEYYGLISSVDIALDSFPYGGGTTTFDALWMGVPVVAAVGDLPVSRSAASVLSALGMDRWIAPSIGDFVDVAVARAADRDDIAHQRRTLRARLEASPLTDHARFARNLEAAFRQMWRTYCE